jgi:hypothetical protein
MTPITGPALLLSSDLKHEHGAQPLIHQPKQNLLQVAAVCLAERLDVLDCAQVGLKLVPCHSQDLHQIKTAAFVPLVQRVTAQETLTHRQQNQCC